MPKNGSWFQVFISVYDIHGFLRGGRVSEVQTKLRNNDVKFQSYTFTEFDVKSMEGNILNGMNEEEIASKIYGVQPRGWKTNLGRSCNHWARARLRNAVEKAVGKTVNNLRKLADGFTIIKKEFTTPFKVGILDNHRRKLIAALEDKNDKDFELIISELLVTTDENKVKIRIEEIPPDFKANQLILQAHNPEIWDLEGNRKRIPDVKIVVGIEGESAKNFLKQKVVRADYEIVPKLINQVQA